MTVSVDIIREAKRYYREFRGDPPAAEEIVSDEDYAYVEYYKPMPVTFGFEIEQPDRKICQVLRLTYEWHYDGSGPYETATPPGTYPGRKIKEFIDTCKRNPDCTWEWVSEMPHPRIEGRIVGCGSHIHFRPREDVEYIRREYLEAWATAHNTLVECVPLVLPMFAWGRDGVFTFRREALYWARLVTRRVSPATMRRFLEPSYTGHPYESVALNKKTWEKPLTLELRLNETHPAIAYELAIILNRIIRKCFERGFVSPKMRDRLDTISKIEAAVRDSIEYGQNLYSTLEQVGPIRFIKGREIPGLDDEYENYLKLFDDILINYGHPYPPMARVCRLFLHRGEPWKNPHAVWNTFAPFGEFRWDQPEIPSM